MSEEPIFWDFSVRTVCLVVEFLFQNLFLKERVLPMMKSKGKEGDKTVVVLVVSLTQSAPCGTAPLYTKVYIVIEHQQHNSYDDFGKLGSWLIKDQGGGEKIQKLENYGRKVFLVNVPPSQSGKIISMEQNYKIWCFFKRDHCSEKWSLLKFGSRVKLNFWNNSGFFQGSRKSQKFKLKKSKLSAGIKSLLLIFWSKTFSCNRN